MKTKDYWITCFKIFTTISVLTAVGFIIALLVLGTKPNATFGMNISFIIIGVVLTTLWYATARMFKRRSPKAIIAGYSLICALALIQIIKGVMYPSQIGASELITFLLYAWFISCVYKAQKQGAGQTDSFLKDCLTSKRFQHCPRRRTKFLG